MKEINIAGRTIGVRHPPFIVAEMSGNHNQSLAKALAIIEAAAHCGVDAVKFQTFTADTMTLNSNQPDFFIDDTSSPWCGRSLYDLYQQACTPWQWHQTLFQRCRELGLIAFSTPFEETAVDFLEELDVPCYKVASFENTDLPLISRIAATGKPVIISTGLASLGELEETVRTLRKAECRNFVLLKCTSTYPASPADSNLNTLPHMASLFDCLVGLSDHTRGLGTAVASVALGAVLIEKHFTLSREQGGVDASFSMEPAEMRLLVQESKRAWQCLGSIRYGPTDSEYPSLKFRRSIYTVKDIKPGECFAPDNIRIIRPGLGLPPKYYESLLGKSVKKYIRKGTPLTWDLLC